MKGCVGAHTGKGYIMTIIKNLARKIADERGIKYTTALREVESKILIPYYDLGGKFASEIESVMPLLRAIKPIKVNTSDFGDFLIFVHPSPGFGGLPGNEFHYLAGDSYLPIIGQDFSLEGLLAPAIFFVHDQTEVSLEPEEIEEFERKYDFMAHGVRDGNLNSEIKPFGDRVVREYGAEFDNYYEGEDFEGLDHYDFAVVMTPVSHLAPNEALTLHVDLRGLSNEDRSSLIAKTVNDTHKERVTITI